MFPCIRVILCAKNFLAVLVRSLVIGASLSVVPSSATGQLTLPSTWHLERYDVRNGLPQSSVHDLAQDSAGFLWITTEAGLVRFDGHNLRGIHVVPGRRALGSRTRSIIVSTSGVLLVDDAPGAMYQIHAHQMAFKLRESGPRAIVTGGLAAVEMLAPLVDSLHAILGWDDPVHLSLLPLGEGGHLMLFQEKLHRTPGAGPSLPEPCPGCNWLVEVEGRRHAVLRAGGSRRVLHNGSLAPAEKFLLPDGTPWNGTVDALYWKLGYPFPVVKAQGKLHRMGAKDQHLVMEALDLPELSATHVLSACPMNGGELLAVGTTNQGLLLYQRHTLRVLMDPAADLGSSSFYTTAVWDKDRFIAVNNKKQAVLFNVRSGTVKASTGPIFDLESISVGSDGRVMGSGDGNLLELDPGTGELTVLDSAGHWYCIFLRENERTWILDDARCGYWENGRYVHTGSTGSSGYLGRPVVALRLPDGKLAYGCYDGLFVDQAGYGAGFALDPVTDGLHIRCLTQMREHLLVGTFGMGLFVRAGDGTLRQAPMDPWNALSHTHAILEHEGTLWISTNRGIVRVELDALIASLDPPHKVPIFNIYGVESGMLIQELNGGCSPAAVQLGDGTMIFPSLMGMVVLHPNNFPAPLANEAFLLGNIWVNGERSPLDKPAVFRHGTERLEIEVSAAHFTGGGMPLYEYRIPGMMKGWVPMPRKAERITMERPNSGIHTLHIRSIGSEHEPEPIWVFKIEKPWYATAMGMLAMALLLIGSGLLGVRLNSMRLIRKNRMLESYALAYSSELAERNQQLSDALSNRETLLSIISHDIVTPLGFVARVSRQAESISAQAHDTARLNATLMDLSASAGKLHVNAKAALDWLRMNPERLNVLKQRTDLCELVDRSMDLWKEMAHARGIVLENAVPPGTMLHTDPLLVQVILNNLLGNCVGHNISARNVSFRAATEGQHFLLVVSDDGQGMDDQTFEQANRMLQRTALGTMDRFLQGDVQGLGFGIIGSLSKLLGATVDLRTGPDGTKVTIRFVP